MNGSSFKNKVSSYEKDYRLIKRTNDPRLGEITIHQNPKTNVTIYCRELRLSGKEQLDNALKQVNKLKACQSPYIINLLDYSLAKHSELCATFFIIKLFFEYPKGDLKLETKNRHENNRTLSVSESIHLLYQTIGAFRDLEENNMFHGNVRPMYIGLDNKRWITKLILKNFEISTKQNIIQVQTKNMKLQQNIYMSPVLLNAVKTNNTNEFDPNKEDMFSLGLVFLEIGTQLKVQDLYKNGKFDTELFNRYLEEFQRLYCESDDKLFNSTIVSMLELNEQDRLTFTQLCNKMPSYDLVKEFLASREGNEEEQQIQAQQQRPQSTITTQTFTNVSQNYNVYQNSPQYRNNSKIIVSNHLSANNPVTQNRREKQGWQTDVQHVIKRIDKSTEKPTIVPYHDKNSHSITYNHPFTKESYHIVNKTGIDPLNPKNGESRVLERVVRKLDNVDGQLVEQVERYQVPEGQHIKYTPQTQYNK